MSRKPLQAFDYKQSHFARPNQDWVCGHADNGQACPQGPTAKGQCCGGQQCAPQKQDGRWVCTRSDLFGGRCSTGPLPGGQCGSALPPCQPKRSVKARRRLTTRWVGAFTVGLLLLLFGGKYGLAMLEPGARVHAHAQIASCNACHEAAEHPKMAWPQRAASSAPDDSQRCLQCHQLGDTPQLAHSLSEAERAALNPISGGSGVSLTSMAARSLLVDSSQALECGQCHREHQGNDADLTAMSNQRCQSCHTAQFGSFSDGHPEFENFPAMRRTRIRFDHAEHIGKYFPESDEPAPQACADCHVTASEQGMMVLRGFDGACASCHSGDIAGAGRADSPGLAVLQVPGFDLAALREAGLAVGAWPEFAESQGGPFFASLLQTDPEASAALAQLAGTDWLDLSDADPATLQAAYKVIWSFKRLMLDLRSQGPTTMLDRLVEAERLPADANQMTLMGGLSVNTIQAAIDAWFPGLLEEWPAHREGSLEVRAATTSYEPSQPAEEETFDDSEFDDLFGGGDDDSIGGGDDIFGGGDEIDLGALSLDDFDSSEAETTEDDADPLEPMALDERMNAGGWYLDDMSLRYRPAGHADALLYSWLSHADSAMIGDTMLDEASPGRCIKCHSVDEVDGQVTVNWQVRRPDPRRHEFTTFSHRSHFSLMGERGCVACHQLDLDSDYNASFADNDPHSFASNFENLDKSNCASCHTSAEAGDNCTSCHNYHVGEFAATEPVNQLSHALESTN